MVFFTHFLENYIKVFSKLASAKFDPGIDAD